MPWLAILLGRWVSGVRFRKPTPEDYRMWFGYFFLAGVVMIAFPILGRQFLEHASGLILWICFVVFGSGLAFSMFLWRFVPAAISLILGIITWGAFVWMMVK
jgi:hypothetical protein